jgi:hypothetical protein
LNAGWPVPTYYDASRVGHSALANLLTQQGGFHSGDAARDRQRKGEIMDPFSSKPNTDAIRMRVGRCSGLAFVDKEHDLMSSTSRPYRLHQPRTTFLKQTLERALTPRAQSRGEALRELERLIAIKADGGSLGVRLHLAGSLARQFPVSHRAITLELFGHGPQGLVDVAEQVELGLWPGFGSRHKASGQTHTKGQPLSKGNSDD